VRVLNIEYFSDSGYPNCRVDTDEGSLVLSSCAIKLALGGGGGAVSAPRSKFADHKIIVPRKWCGNDSRMVLRDGFTTNPAIVKIAQDFVEACHTGTFEPGPVTIPAEPPQYINVTSPPRRFRHSIVWPLEGAQTLGSQLVRITRREEP